MVRNGSGTNPPEAEHIPYLVLVHAGQRLHGWKSRKSGKSSQIHLKIFANCQQKVQKCQQIFADTRKRKRRIKKKDKREQDEVI